MKLICSYLAALGFSTLPMPPEYTTQDGGDCDEEERI